MKKIIKNLTCEIRLQYNQEVELTESELKKLEKYLETNSDAGMYMRINDGLEGLILYTIFFN